MKSRIPGKNDGRILLYGYTPEETQLFKEELQRRGLMALRLSAVPPNAAEQQLGSLAGLANYSHNDNNSNAAFDKKTPVKSDQDRCIVFSGLSSNQLYKALDILRSCGIAAPLKAVLTPHNAKYTLNQLIAELKKEHKAITGEEL